jgi:hypothetical protein
VGVLRGEDGVDEEQENTDELPHEDRLPLPDWGCGGTMEVER